MLFDNVLTERAKVIIGHQVKHDLNVSDKALGEYNYIDNNNWGSVTLDPDTYSSMTQEDGFDSILKMFPEHLDLDKLKEIKESVNYLSDTIVDIYKDYVYGEIFKVSQKFNKERANVQNDIEIDNVVSKYSGILLWMRKEIELLTNEGLSYESIQDYILKAYFPPEIDDPETVRRMINMRLKYNEGIVSLLKSMLKINYSILDIEEKEAELYINQLITDQSKGVSNIRKLIEKNADKFIVDNHMFDFRKIGGGIVYGTQNFLDSERYMKPERLFLYSLKYDAVVYTHGDDNDVTWTIEPVKTLSGRVFVDTVDLVKDLVMNCGHKNILLMHCNPGGYLFTDSFLDKLPDDVTITYGTDNMMSESYTISNNNNEYPEYLIEAEKSLMDICKENGFSYHDDELLQESYEYVYSNMDIVIEGRFTNMIKSFAKKIFQALVYLWKKMIEFFKMIYNRILGFFKRLKNSKASLKTDKPIKTSYITLESASVKIVTADNLDQLRNNIIKSCESISKEIKKRSNEQIKLTQKLNSDISSGKIKLYESYDDIDIEFDYFI